MNMAELQERLSLLLEQQVITTHSSNVTELSFQSLSKTLGLENVVQSEMLFTHLPNALSRIEKGEMVESPPPEVVNEVRSSIHFPIAEKQVNLIEQTWGKNLPQGEKEYLYLHYTNILNANKMV